MNVDEAIAAIENEAENIGGEYHYVAMRISNALDVIRAHVERKVDDAMVERYELLKKSYVAANFFPMDPKGLDLGEDGVALIFLLPKTTAASKDLDATLDSAIAALGVEG